MGTWRFSLKGLFRALRRRSLDAAAPCAWNPRGSNQVALPAAFVQKPALALATDTEITRRSVALRLLEQDGGVEGNRSGWQIEGGELRLKKRAILETGMRVARLRIEQHDVANSDSLVVPKALKLIWQRIVRGHDFDDNPGD